MARNYEELVVAIINYYLITIHKISHTYDWNFDSNRERRVFLQSRAGTEYCTMFHTVQLTCCSRDIAKSCFDNNQRSIFVYQSESKEKNIFRSFRIHSKIMSIYWITYIER